MTTERGFSKIGWLAAGGIVGAAAGWAIPTLWGRPWRIDDLFTRVFASFVRRRPMMLSSLRLLEPWGIRFHARRLDDFSGAFLEREADWASRELAILASYDRRRLDPARRLSSEILAWFLDDIVRGRRFIYHDYPVNQAAGIQSELIDFLVNTHQVTTRRDADDWLARVASLGTALDQVGVGLLERQRRGIVPPRFVVRRVIDEVERLLGCPVDKHPLMASFRASLWSIDLEPALRERLTDRAEALVRQVVRPAYAELREILMGLEQVAPEEVGVWHLPDGDAYYAHCLRHHTTTDMGAEQIHELGLEQVALLEDEMRAILHKQGYHAADLGRAMTDLAREPRFLYPDSDGGREAILDDYRAIIAEMESHVPELFAVAPDVVVAVDRVPPFKEATAPGAYYEAAPLDRSRPGTFWANLRSVGEVPKFGMRTLAYHEAVPGHHFQIGIAQAERGLPLFRRTLITCTAYVEGWALYAERLAAENGFQDDPFDRLGYLTAQIFRAARLVVDTGIHHKRWTRERAIAYMLETTGMPETDVVAEVERYVVWPGQACAYMVGQLELLRLRVRARARLGERFDLRGFHDVLLRGGAMPLPVLAGCVDDWIESRG